MLFNLLGVTVEELWIPLKLFCQLLDSSDCLVLILEKMKISLSARQGYFIMLINLLTGLFHNS